MLSADVLFLARDFFLYLRGRDYFHLPQPLGDYWTDERCYYNSLRRKLLWEGNWKDGVPVLYLPTLKKEVHLPVMVLQYGLGCIDSWAIDKRQGAHAGAQRVYHWIEMALRPDCTFDNMSSIVDPANSYVSENNCMSLGQAISFLSRVHRFELFGPEFVYSLDGVEATLARNMLRPVSFGGTAIQLGAELYLCEYCRDDFYVVLNGWIFGLFGLLDYLKRYEDSVIQAAAMASIDTLERKLAAFMLRDGWSLYDSAGRMASPHYHSLHGALIEALGRLSGRRNLLTAAERLERSNHWFNRIKYGCLKVRDRVFRDRYRHTTTRRRCG